MQVCLNMTLKTHLLRRINKHLTKQNKSQKEKELEFNQESSPGRKLINPRLILRKQMARLQTKLVHRLR